jgi:hypothetical protein
VAKEGATLIIAEMLCTAFLMIDAGITFNICDKSGCPGNLLSLSKLYVLSVATQTYNFWGLNCFLFYFNLLFYPDNNKLKNKLQK